MRVVVAVLCLVFAGTANAIYKCKNPDGSISFSDAPCGARDEGVDMEKERQYQAAQEERARAEQERMALERRERNARLTEIRKRKVLFAKQYYKIIEDDAFVDYTEEAHPEIAKRFDERLLEIEQSQMDAVRLTLNSQQCDKVKRAELDLKQSSPQHFSIMVSCNNGKRFRLTDQQIDQGVVPKAVIGR